MRCCRVCKTEKELSEFVTSRDRPGGKKSICKACDEQRLAEWRAANRDHVLAYWADWRDGNRARMAAYSRKSNQKLMANVVARVGRYLKAHPEKRAQFKRNRRAREKGAAGSHSAAQLADLFASYLGLCVYCCESAEEPDHIVPLAAGGSNEIGNIVPACCGCNRSKKDKPLIVWMAQRAAA